MPMMFFYFLKIIFDISTSKRSKRYKPHSILAKKKKKKNLKFTKKQVEQQSQTLLEDGALKQIEFKLGKSFSSSGNRLRFRKEQSFRFCQICTEILKQKGPSH
jgi:hypothetical protein